MNYITVNKCYKKICEAAFNRGNHESVINFFAGKLVLYSIVTLLYDFATNFFHLVPI